MLDRLASDRLRALSRAFPAVLVLGPRQVGKTTLVRATFPELPYIDLEEPRTRALFDEDPRFQIESRAAPGLVLDEVQAVPDVLPALRGLIDADRQARGRYLLLGSAQPTLVRGVSESLAGRVGILDLDPLVPAEGGQLVSPDRMWLAGGYPDAVLGDFREWSEAYLRSYVERDLPSLGFPAEPIFVRRLLTMLAHQQGGLLNTSSLAGALGVSAPRVARFVDVLEQTFLVRRLTPFHRNIGKRLVKSPKLYLRDTGLLHHLLGIATAEDLASHPIRGASFETFVVEDLVRRYRLVHPSAQFHFWRTAAGAEADLLIEVDGATLLVEVKAGRADARASRTLRDVATDLGVKRAWILDRGEGEEAMNEVVVRRSHALDPHWLPGV